MKLFGNSHTNKPASDVNLSMDAAQKDETSLNTSDLTETIEDISFSHLDSVQGTNMGDGLDNRGSEKLDAFDDFDEDTLQEIDIDNEFHEGDSEKPDTFDFFDEEAADLSSEGSTLPENFDSDAVSDTDGNPDGGEIALEKRRHPHWKIAVLSVVIVLVVVLGVLAIILNYFLNLINYQSADSDYFVTVSTEEELPEETPINSKLAAIDEAEAAESLEATEEELSQWNQELEDITSDSSTYEIPITEEVFNILLIGSDTREQGGAGRSDAMILMSINQKTETIYLTSFLRDSYVHIPEYGNTRLNHAFAYGGPDLLEQTLEENFKVHIDRYIAVDFFSFMDVIDILGGVYIDVTEEEMDVTNDYIWSMNNLMGEEWYNDYLWNAGWQKLNGKQALCYARNRYTGNDYARTQRQRNIISQIITGAKEASPSTLVDLAQVIFPQITTDMKKSEILNYAANIGAYMNYSIVSQQVPTAGTYSGTTISGMSVIRMDLDENIEFLQDTIYAGTSYDTNAESTVDDDSSNE